MTAIGSGKRSEHLGGDLVDGVMRLRGTEIVAPPERVTLAAGMDAPVGAGTGWQYGARLAVSVERSFPDYLPDARDLLALALPHWQAGELLDAADAQPVYLRDEIATPRAG